MEHVDPSLFVIDWKAVGVLVAVVGGWSAMLVGAIKWLMDRYQSHIDQRFDDLAKARRAADEDRGALRRELSALKELLPLTYVLREDAVRDQTVVHAKLDKLAELIMEKRHG